MSDSDEARRLLREAEGLMGRGNVTSRIEAARVWAMLATGYDDDDDEYDDYRD